MTQTARKQLLLCNLLTGKCSCCHQNPKQAKKTSCLVRPKEPNAFQQIMHCADVILKCMAAAISKLCQPLLGLILLMECVFSVVIELLKRLW